MSATKILVVDHDINRATTIKHILEQSSYKVVTAKNGTKGLNIAYRNLPDLILVDVALPGMPGSEFVRRYRKLEERHNQLKNNTLGSYDFLEVPVIYITDSMDSNSGLENPDVSAVDYINKAINPNELCDCIGRHLQQARNQKEAVRLLSEQLSQLESMVKSMRAGVHECVVNLSYIDSYIEMIESIHVEELDRTMQFQAKRRRQNLEQSLMQIIEWSGVRC